MATKPRTAAERYLAKQRKSPEYRAAHDRARGRIGQIDTIVRALDDRRTALGLTKAELARRADLAPEAVRRLFSVQAPNPTIVTLVALTEALDLELTVAPRPNAQATSKDRTPKG